MTNYSAKAAIKKPVRLMIVVFVLISCLFLFGKDAFRKNNIDDTVVLIGNLLLFLISLFNTYRSAGAIDNTNPQVFVRAFYGGFLIRLLVCGAAAFVYIYSQQGKINKPALFICLGIYVIYSLIETTTLKRIFNDKQKTSE